MYVTKVYVYEIYVYIHIYVTYMYIMHVYIYIYIYIQIYVHKYAQYVARQVDPNPYPWAIFPTFPLVSSPRWCPGVGREQRDSQAGFPGWHCPCTKNGMLRAGGYTGDLSFINSIYSGERF